MKLAVILAAVAAAIGVPGAHATAPQASCVGTLTSFEAHLAPGFVGQDEIVMLSEVTALDRDGDGRVRFTLGGSAEVTAAVAILAPGAGDSAAQAVLNLADAGARVTMCVRGEALGRTTTDYLVARIEKHPLIDLRLRTEVRELHAGENHLRAVTVEVASGTQERKRADRQFLCIGGEPRTGWAEVGGVCTDRAGYILTGPDLLESGRRPESWPLDRDPLALETRTPGVFCGRRRPPRLDQARRGCGL